MPFYGWPYYGWAARRGPEQIYGRHRPGYPTGRSGSLGGFSMSSFETESVGYPYSNRASYGSVDTDGWSSNRASYESLDSMSSGSNYYMTPWAEVVGYIRTVEGDLDGGGGTWVRTSERPSAPLHGSFMEMIA